MPYSKNRRRTSGCSGAWSAKCGTAGWPVRIPGTFWVWHEVWGWPDSEWVVHLLSFLSGKAQLVAQQQAQPPVCVRQTAPRYLSKVAAGRGVWRLRICQPHGAGATRGDGRMGPVPLSGVIRWGGPAGRGPLGSISVGRWAHPFSLPLYRSLMLMLPFFLPALPSTLHHENDGHFPQK